MGLCSFLRQSVALAALASFASASDLDATAQQDLKRLVKELREAHHVPSVSVAIVRPDKPIWCKAWGESNVATSTKATTETVYATASLLKPITATTLLCVLRDGKLHDGIIEPTADMRDWVPSKSAPKDPVSFDDVLSHRLRTQFGPGSSRVALWRWDAVGAARFQIQNLEYSVRSRSKYDGDHNSTYYLAGFLAARLAGSDVGPEWLAAYEQQVILRVLNPLGMNRTSLQPDQRFVERLAIPYSRGGLRTLPTLRSRFHAVPAAEAYSTPHDLARFLSAHLNEGKMKGATGIPPEVVASSHKSRTTDPDFALGWWRWQPKGQDLIWHTGQGVGFSGISMGDLKTRMGICVLLNCHADIKGKLFKALKTMSQTVLLRLAGEQSDPERPLSDYFGRFSSGGEFLEIVLWDTGRIGRRSGDERVPLERSDASPDLFLGRGDAEAEPVEFSRFGGLVRSLEWGGKTWRRSPFGPPPISSVAALAKAEGTWSGLLTGEIRTYPLELKIFKQAGHHTATLKLSEEGESPVAVKELRIDEQGGFSAEVEFGSIVATLRGRLEDSMIAGRFVSGPYDRTFVVWSGRDQPRLAWRGTWRRTDDPSITLVIDDANNGSVQVDRWNLRNARLRYVEWVGREVRFETEDVNGGVHRWACVVTKKRMIGSVRAPNGVRHELDLELE